MSILDIFRSEKRKVADSSGDTLRMTNSGGVNYVDSSAYESRNINITDIEPIRTFDNMPVDVANIAYKNFSSWQNNVASVGINNSLAQYSHHILNRLSYQECANLATDSMISKAIDVIVREIFKSGGKWEATHLDIDNFEMILNSLDFYNKITLAVQRALEYGGAFIYINTDDTNLSLPLYINEKTSKKNKITGLTVIEPWQAAPVQVNTFNPLKNNYMQPDLWWVLGASSTVHKTRLIPIVFYSVPDLIKPLYNYLGLPLSFYMKNYVSNADTVRQSISDLVLRFRTKIIKTTAQKIADPQTQARVKYMNATSNNLATLLLAKDEEWIETVTSLSGMDNLLSQMYELMTASTRGIPVTKLLGLSPRGFNATGEYDENNFYDVIDGYASSVVIPAMEKSAEYILCFKAGVLDEPKYTFNPRKQIKQKEQVEINNLKADYVSKLIMSGVITGKDAIRAISEDNFNFDWINSEDYKIPENPEVEKDILNQWMDEWKESEHDRDENGRFKGNGKSNNVDTIESEKTEYGEAFTQFKGKPKQAIEHLLKVRRGYVPGAFHRSDIGDIDLVWGNKHYGLKHIEKQRNKKGQDFNKLIEEITDAIENGKMIDDEWDENIKVIVDETKKILIKLTWDDEKVKNQNRNWLFNGYFKYEL